MDIRTKREVGQLSYLETNEIERPFFILHKLLVSKKKKKKLNSSSTRTSSIKK